MTSVQPIKPSEVGAKKATLLPGFVIEAFNQIIAEKYNEQSKSATVKQDAVIARIIQLGTNGESSPSRNEVFNNGWLEVETIFKAAGWKVEYTKPDYTESFEPYYEFRAK